MKKSARVSEKLVSPGFPGLQVATCLAMVLVVTFNFKVLCKLIFCCFL